MFPRKIYCSALLFIAVTACSKQEVNPSSTAVSLSDSSYASAQAKGSLETIYGLAEEKTTDEQKRRNMQTADVDIIRLTIFLSQTTANRVADDYLAQGYKVQLCISWNTGTLTNRGFPTPKDTSNVRARAEEFFKYYANRKSQIPFVSIENEWDHEVQSGFKLQDYINEVAIITSVGRKYGFKIADGGITYASLQRWTYSQLKPAAQTKWKQTYYVGLNSDYDELVDMVNTYAEAAKKINFDYSNVHWANQSACGGGYRTATQAFMRACNKKTNVCNEFAVKTNSLTLFSETVDEIDGNALYAIAYNGTNRENKAITLTNQMLLVLAAQ